MRFEIVWHVLLKQDTSDAVVVDLVGFKFESVNQPTGSTAEIPTKENRARGIEKLLNFAKIYIQ